VSSVALPAAAVPARDTGGPSPGRRRQGQSWSEEGRDLVRAASGGLLFGVPLLYTMEVWWLGSHTSPGRMLVVLAALFGILLVLNATAGFRRSRDVTLVEAVEDSVKGIAVGVVMTAFVLVVLRQVTLETPLTNAIGSVVNESIPFCLGVGVARLLLEGDPGMAEDEGGADGRGGGHGAEDGSDGSDGANASTGQSDEASLRTNAADIGGTALGAIVIGLSIAPTDEVPMLASAMAPSWQVVVVVASLVISYTVVFIAGFSGQDRRRQHQGLFQRPVTETLVTYLVALVVAAALLWTFQRDLTPADDLLTRVIVLGLPAAVGGAVGRLAL